MHRSLVTAGAIVVLLVACTTSMAVAQRLSLGARIGAVTSHAVFQDDINNELTEPRTSFETGAVVSWNLNGYLALRAEALYAQKGWLELNTGGGRRFGYLNLPLALEISAPISPSPYLSVGSFVAFEVDCAVTDVPGAGSVPCDDPAVSTSRRTIDYGMLGGFGVGQDMRGGKLSVDLTVMFGIRDLNKEPLPPGYMRLLTISVSGRYMVPIGG